MTTLPASARVRNAVAVVGLLNLVIAPLPYLFAWLFAYAFNDHVDASTHVFFLIEVAGIAVVIAALATLPVRAAAAIGLRQAFWLSLWLSLTFHLTVVGIGSIISANYADQGSVTAEYPWTTDVLLAAGLLGGAAIAAWIAFRARPR